ncbi:hypothetical protein GCM10029976_052910 [Kribbella albertanoniae]
MQPAGGQREAALVRHCHEVLQLPQFHSGSVSLGRTDRLAVYPDQVAVVADQDLVGTAAELVTGDPAAADADLDVTRRRGVGRCGGTFGRGRGERHSDLTS